MSFRCVVGGSRAAREALARRHAGAAGLRLLEPPPVSRWPFERHVLPDQAGSHPCVIWLPDLHTAFLAGQSTGTRLVLTQSTYQLQRWLDWLSRRPDALVVAHANRAGLRSTAPEAFARRGPWSRIELLEIEGEADDDDAHAGPGGRLDAVRAAFVSGSQQARLDACTQAAAGDPGNPALQLASASAYMELGALQPAQEALDRALALAPDWEAVWFEYGKLWLRADDLERASERFAGAARLMPSFAAALSNLGAALGELDRVDEAVSALRQALVYDAEGYPILNNLGVICREHGRLDEAIEAGRRVIQIAPGFVFGYYNLAHALFLQGRFDESRDLYGEGVARDPQKNQVQACRFAVARAAAGEAGAAVADLRTLAESLPGDARDQILGEAAGTLAAVAGLSPSRAASVREVLTVVKELAIRRR